MRFTKKRIKALLTELGRRLRQRGLEAEIGVVGGAAMVLAYDARAATMDIDAVFKPAQSVRDVAREIAAEKNLPKDWLNDGVKGFMPGPPRKRLAIFDSPGIHVWAPETEYMLAMKAMSARADTMDTEDLKLLIGRLRLKSPGAVFAIVENYYPRREIPARVKFFVEAVFDDLR